MKDDREKLADDPTYVAHRVSGKLARLWNDTNVNRSRLRAVFRRWRPDTSGTPTFEMLEEVWNHFYPPANLIVQSIIANSSEPKLSEDSEETLRIREIAERYWTESQIRIVVGRTAVITSLRAVAGEGNGEGVGLTLGKALYKTGMKDRRFVRLIRTPAANRLEALRRAMQYIAQKDVSIDWSHREVKTIYYFLFGSDDQAKRSIDRWAGDFLSERSKKSKEQSKEN